MNPKAIKLAQTLAKRPKDRTIAMIRIIAGLIIMSVVFLGRDNFILDLPFWLGQYEMYIEYALIVWGFVVLMWGLLRACIFKHKTLRILQVVVGFFLIFLGFPIMDPDTSAVEAAAATAASEEIQLGQSGSQATPEVPHNPGWILGLLGFVPLFLGITGKGTYSHCIKYREKITTIRV